MSKTMAQAMELTIVKEGCFEIQEPFQGSSVFHATSGERAVAAKLFKLPSYRAERPALLEAAVLLKLRHPCIIDVLGVARAQDASRLYIVMEAAAESLRQVMKRQHRSRGEHDTASALRWMYHVALALQHAHSNGIFHSDVKPENILMCNGDAKLADFGLAEAVRDDLTTTLRGTVLYMAPEQFCRDAAVGTFSDVYSFGLVLFELIAELPPPQKTPFAPLRQRVNGEFPPIAEAQEAYKRSVAAGVLQMDHASVQNPSAATQLALQCLNAVAASRPTMSDVVRFFEDELHMTPPQASPVPPAPRHGGGFDQFVTLSLAAAAATDQLEPGSTFDFCGCRFKTAHDAKGKGDAVKIACGELLAQDSERAWLWFLLGRCGGHRIDNVGYDPAACYERALRCDAKHVDAWGHLGSTGGGRVHGVKYSEAACYVQALTLSPQLSDGWCCLGIAGGGTVAKTIFSNADCFVRALELDRHNANAWCCLGDGGGGTLDDTAVSAVACYEAALTIDARHADAWHCLGEAGGGRVGEEQYLPLQCFQQALRVDPFHVEAHKAAQRTVNFPKGKNQAKAARSGRQCCVM
jgi:hypothetical protein